MPMDYGKHRGKESGFKVKSATSTNISILFDYPILGLRFLFYMWINLDFIYARSQIAPLIMPWCRQLRVI